MKPDEIKISLPAPLAQAVSGYDWRQNQTGFSPARVFRLSAKDKNALYLKISPRSPAHSLLQEKIKLDWLRNRLPVPEVVLFIEDEANEYLLLSEISGTDASDDSLKNDIPQIVGQLVTGLKMIHSLPVENCPFDARIDNKIDLAGKLVENGLVDEDDFDEIRQGRTAGDLFRELIENKPAGEDLVFTHGDYCAPNVILKNGKLSGFVDWGNAGIADRYQDIALLTRSILHNFNGKYEKNVFDLEDIVFEIYGIKPDRKKIQFYRLLDEFF